MTLEGVSYRVFGKYAKKFSIHFLDIKDEMQRANIKYTLEEWLSMAMFVSFATFAAELIIFAFMFGLLGVEPLIAVLLSITLSTSIAGVLLFLFYVYPGNAAKNRENSIKKVLPFAVSYLSSISTKDMSPVFFFKTLGQFEEYGEVAKDSRSIVRDVEVFGMSIHTAIKKRANRTPSKEFKDLLWGFNNIYDSGGNIEVYLRQKANELMNDYRRRIKKYSQDLSLFVEVYLTLIIVGAIFFIVLSSVIAAISSGAETATIHTFIVFIMLPILSTGFILLIRSISPIS
jgi:archaeal flagellar protein FlaJ